MAKTTPKQTTWSWARSMGPPANGLTYAGASPVAGEFYSEGLQAIHEIAVYININTDPSIEPAVYVVGASVVINSITCKQDVVGYRRESDVTSYHSLIPKPFAPEISGVVVQQAFTYDASKKALSTKTGNDTEVIEVIEKLLRSFSTKIRG